MRTVVGDGWPFIAGKVPASGNQSKPSFSAAELGGTGSSPIEVPDYGRYVDQPVAISGAALLASLNRPLALAWRRNGGIQELFIYDSYNNAIRKASVAIGGDFRDAAVTTAIGRPRTFIHADPGYSVAVGTAGSVSEGPASAALLDLARYNPDDQSAAQVVNGGLAIDPDLGRLFITDTNNQAIRMLDLTTNQVSILAAHDARLLEGDARRVLLSGDLAGLAVLRDHSVLFADCANNVIRQVHLESGW